MWDLTNEQLVAYIGQSFVGPEAWKAVKAELLRRLTDQPPEPVVKERAWQPIETAPKDGRHILAAVFSTNSIGFGGDPQQSWQDVVHYWKWADGTHQEEWGWYPSYGPADYALKNLTHWKPLQELAERAGRGEELPKAEEFTRKWYEQMKADDPHHFAEHDDQDENGFYTIPEYTFELFRKCPFVKSALKVLASLCGAPRPMREVSRG